MTDRQWLIWQLIDMSDEEFRRTLNYKYCIHKDVGKKYKRNCPRDCSEDCLNGMLAWLQQEHEEG
jgi:hypothetical protein